MTEPMLRALGRLALQRIVVDEAHCISRWGPAFPARLRATGPTPRALRRRTDRSVHRHRRWGDAQRHRGQFVCRYGQDPSSPASTAPTSASASGYAASWKRQLLDFVRRRADQSGIVYCLSRRKTEEAAALLAGDGVPALAYHAGMEKGRARRQPGRVHDRAGRGDGRHHRLRHGHRQARRALRLSHRPAGKRRGLLPGARPRRARRPAGRGAHALRPRRHPHAGAPSSRNRATRRTSGASTSVSIC